MLIERIGYARFQVIVIRKQDVSDHGTWGLVVYCIAFDVPDLKTQYSLDLKFPQRM
jgi:hypothetical protein